MIDHLKRTLAVLACAAGLAMTAELAEAVDLVPQRAKLATAHTFFQDQSVARSADGDTAIVGAYAEDTGCAGSALIYVSSGGVWTQQGPKLIGSGCIGQAYQGSSVGLSADGNTLLIGGPLDNNVAGAIWVFVRSGTAWT